MDVGGGRRGWWVLRVACIVSWFRVMIRVGIGLPNLERKRDRRRGGVSRGAIATLGVTGEVFIFGVG